MKKLLAVLFCVAFLMSFSYAGWTGGVPLPDTTGGVHYRGDGHGLTVTPDGRIWYMSYSSVDTVICDDGNDGDTDTLNTRAIYVWNPDGTPAPFSPVKKLVYPDGAKDTLLWSGRGMRADHAGNVVVVNFDEARRINYLTGEGMNQCYPATVVGSSSITPGFDSDNNMFIGQVVPPSVIKVYDADMAYVGDVVAAAAGYSRAMAVSADGKDIFWCGYSTNTVEIFHSDDGLDGIYASTDTIKNISVESLEFQPVTGYLWMGQSYATVEDTVIHMTKKLGCFYAYDLTTKTYVDSIIVDFTGKNAAGTGTSPRGMGFSPNGQICYATFFSNPQTNFDGIYKFEKLGGVWKETGKFVTGYNLDQNYPNPFNATTVIPYSINKSGNVKLTVFDLLGHEVKTLVSERMEAGDYTYKLDASGLATGMYIYRLDVNGVNISKRMMYVK